MTTSKGSQIGKGSTADELGRALGLSVSDTAEMEFRSELTVSLAKIIQSGRLTHADIAKRAGTSERGSPPSRMAIPRVCRPICSSECSPPLVIASKYGSNERQPRLRGDAYD